MLSYEDYTDYFYRIQSKYVSSNREVAFFGVVFSFGKSNQVLQQQTHIHSNDDIMSKMASQLTSLRIVYSTVYSGANQRKHQSSASLAFVRGIRR